MDRVTRREAALGAASLLALSAVPAAAQGTGASRLQPLETVFLSDVAPGNVTVTPERRVVFSAHPAFPAKVTAVIVDPDGTRIDVTVTEEGRKVSVLSVRAVEDEQVWMMDGAPGTPAKKLYLIDATTGRPLRSVAIDPAVTAPSSFLNDIAVDSKRGLFYLSDPANGAESALVVLDPSGKGRRVLQGHASVRQPPGNLVIRGRPVGGPNAAGVFQPMGGGVNPITIDAANEWVYYGAMSGTAVYRIPAADLANPALGDAELARRVQTYAPKHPSAGITIDNDGRIYVTDPGASGIGVIWDKEPYRLIAQDDKLLDWPDGMAVDDSGFVYVCQNGLYRNQASHKTDPGGGPPYAITRFGALGPTTVGR